MRHAVPPLRLLLALLALAASGLAQIPDKFTNLQVLPKDISKKDLVRTMRGFATDLGVRCGYCHVGGDTNTLQGVNFPSDESDKKKTARAMLRMTLAINSEYLAKMELRPAQQVTCLTCHHRLADPRPIEAVLTESLEKDGPEAAVALYRKLKSETYGSGRYDFSDIPLNGLGETLLEADKLKEAVAILELDAEMNPESAWGRYLLGVAHNATGEKEKARADFQKALELNPKNAMAKKRLEELDKPK